MSPYTSRFEQTWALVKTWCLAGLQLFDMLYLRPVVPFFILHIVLD